MSKVSLKNEILPSFEPIEHKPTTQKRKRNTTLKDTSSNNNEKQPTNKKPKVKKNGTQAIVATKSVVWIGATLMQQHEKDDTANNEASAAFSIYYGLDDSRNYTEKMTIKKDQALDYVYSMGVMRFLEKSVDDSSNLHIHTGSQLLEQVIDKEDNDICNQIKEKISKRKGSTSIHYKAQSLENQDELQAAHTLASEKLEDKMMIDDEQTLVDSLEVTETEVVVTTTRTETTIIKDEQDKELEKSVVVTSIEEEVTTSSTIEAVPTTTTTATSSGWMATLNLRNLLEVLKAPFYRNNK